MPKLKIIIVYKITLLILTFFILNGCQKTTSIDTIGILQFKPQEWADDLQQGFKDGLDEQGIILGEDVTIITRSAAGDPQTLSTIAEGFSRSDYKLIYSLGTQTTQEIFNRTKTKAILFGAVTDPVKAGFYEDNLENPLGNISGTQDLWPYEAQFDLITTLIPDINKIGIIYNSSEINSQVSVNHIKNTANNLNIEIEERTITAGSEIQTAVAAILSRNVDLFFIPADNTAQTSSSTIIALCNNKGIPVFTGIPGIVEAGALATVGTNYYELGKINAKQAATIIRTDSTASDLPVEIAQNGDIYINLKTAEEFNIEIPQNIIDNAYQVYK